ncbi:MAG TPA: GNAT family N-acetyltransferase [Acidimicrobiales bacterium]
MASRRETVALRNMTENDFAVANQVWRDAFATSTEFPSSPTPPTAAEHAAAVARRAHLLRHDPGGSFVAVADGEVIGIAQAHLREGTFVLAMLAVAPDFQDLGIGQRLLSAALDYSSGATAAYIFSSSDPRAIHRYVRAGFTLRPAVEITGREPIAELDLGHIRVSDGTPEDLEYVESIDRALRGSARGVDIAFWLEGGATLLLHEEAGYAVLSANRLNALGAANESVAGNLLAAVLSGHPDGVLRSASWIAGEQQWAIEQAARQRAKIEVHGAVMTRGIEHLPNPYLPNGLFG